jgi:hypothetical protein
MQIIDDLIETMQTTKYEHSSYDGKKSESTLLSRHQGNETIAMRQVLLEFMQKNFIDAKLENEGLKQRIMILKACVNNSNFAPIIKPPRAKKANQ